MSGISSLKKAASAAVGALGHKTASVRIGHSAERVAPVEFRDAAAAYARKYGGHGDIVWVPAPVYNGQRIGSGFWQVRFTLLPGDPRLKNRDGDVFETVELHRFVHPDPAHPAYPNHEEHLLRRLSRRGKRNQLLPGFIPIELGELGVNGMIQMLEEGDILSGRGKFKSAEEAMLHVLRQQREAQERKYRAGREAARHMASDVRRQVFKIPFLGIGIELNKRRSREGRRVSEASTAQS